MTVSHLLVFCDAQTGQLLETQTYAPRGHEQSSQVFPRLAIMVVHL